MENYLNFQPIKPIIDVSFWLHFTNLKLDEWKLDNPKVHLHGKIPLPMNQQHPSNLLLDDFSLKQKKKKTIGGLLQSQVDGMFFHYNTIEEYQGIDLHAIAELEGQSLIQNPSDFNNVNKFIIVSFGDLKNYNYHFKFLNLEIDGNFEITKSNRIDKFFQKEQIEKFENSVLTLIKSSEDDLFCFVLIKNQDSQEYQLVHEVDERLFLAEEAFFCYFDPSPLLPSILLKNYLSKLQIVYQNLPKEKQGKDPIIKIISIRDKISRITDQVLLSNTFYIEVKLKQKEDDPNNGVLKIKHPNYNLTVKETIIGLKEQMDPKVIAENAVDLNLKLMKWRMLPGLNLDIIQNTSVLLLGSGSLGCQVARSLLSWGYRKITFVDWGKVSYSNPVRQSLFTFEDSQKPDNYKCEIAAQRLQEIFPSVVTRGERLRIPMPGHAVSTEEAVKEAISDMNKLDTLIQEHDSVFLLTDSRESRWLPTVLAAFHNKICFTIALGFETFLVMRHGLSAQTHNPITNGDRLGCYFCNDVVAPRDSMSDRTLDQQCTVSRPALCTMSGALGVELLTSIVNHPLKQGAKANENPGDCDKSCLGIIPQQIRGDLSYFGINVMFGEAFEKCIGCSSKILEAFKENREEFLIRALNKPDYLEDVTGITQMLEKIKMDEIENFDFDDDMI